MPIRSHIFLCFLLIFMSSCNYIKADFKEKTDPSTAPISIPDLSFIGATGTNGGVGSTMTVVPPLINDNGSPITNCTITPSLPAGLTIDPNTCSISGVPSAPLSPTIFTITVYNSVGSIDADVTLSITASVPSLSYSGATGTNGAIGVVMTVTPSTLNSNGAVVSNCTSSPALPAGLSISTTTCVISGTPTTATASASYTITATNSVGSNTATVTLVVGASAPTISYSGATGTSGNAGTAMTVTPTTLSDNGAAVTACSSSPALPTGLTINATTCVISGTPSVAAASASYTITATNSAGSNTGTVTLVIAAAAPVLSYTGSTGTSGSVGVAMTVTPSTLATNGAAITACSSGTALPTGLSISATTCVISGTPTSPFASASYTITATNSAGTGSGTVTLSVAASAPSISFVGATGTSGTVGTAMSVAPMVLNNNGASITGCSSSPALPSGLSINSSTCIISGTPTAVTSSTTYTITATNSAGSTNASVDLAVVAGAPTISFASSTGTVGNAGAAMSVTPSTLTNNGSAITNCVASTTLPTGLSINATNCVISGTPSARLSSTSFTITATNGIGSTNATVSLEVGCPIGYIPVDADPTLGLPAFCVMKYEAKCATTIAGTTSCSSSTGAASASKIAVSTANGLPWLQISGNDAIIACQNLNAIHGVTTKYDILSNTEWIAIARSIELEPTNWTNVAGVEKLNIGHTDSSPAGVCDGNQVNVQTNCSTVGTDFHQKRTHTLLNNSEIWDMAGNVWELVDWVVEVPNSNFSIGPSNCQNTWLEIQNQITNCNPNLGSPSPSASSSASPVNINLDSSNNIGYIYGSDNGGQGAAHRGGSFNAGVFAGIFTLSLNYVPNGSSSNTLGFRCVFRD